MTIKVSVADVEDMACECYSGDLKVVEVGDWISEGKYESCEVIFTDGERYYSATAMRSGSYFSDYSYNSEWDDGEADVVEVAKVPVTRTEWQPVIERGVHVYEEPCPEEGSYCLTDAELAQKKAEAIVEYGEDIYVVIGPAVRTKSGWHAPKLDGMEAA